MRNKYRSFLIAVALLSLSLYGVRISRADDSPTPKGKQAAKPKKAASKPVPKAENQDTDELKRTLENQARTIDALTRSMSQMRAQMEQQMSEIQSLKSGLDQSRATAEEANKKASELASLPDQVKTLASNEDGLSKNVLEVKKSADDAKKTSEGVAKGLNGFRFSGDFRLRYDGIFRSSNAALGTTAVQNSRARYRLRLNVDKTLDKYIDFHMQLGTGPVNNPLTFDQDFTSITTRHPFFISEAWADVHNESRTISVQGGKVQEVFADNSRFLFDDDVRFSGFNEKYVYQVPDGNALKSVEFRAGQYIFTNPNVAIVTSSSPLASAGLPLGTIARNAAMFHEGVVFKGDITSNLSHEFVFDDQWYRNPNEIQLASTTNGYPVLVNGGLGITLSGPLTGTGNGTTTSGGAMYTAPDFNVVRLGYRMDWKGLSDHPKFPFTWNVQVARNTSAEFLRDAFLTSLSIGQSKGAGDWRFLYIWSIKDANALISQLTDDDLGTSSGVNIATHHFRVDYTIRKGLVWQNLVFIQNERRPTNPAQLFFVPLQSGTPTQYRYQSQLQFSF
jgi:hypothetical protein